MQATWRVSGGHRSGRASALGKAFTGFVGEGREERVLEGRVVNGGVGFLAVLVVPVAAAGARFRVVAGGEPLLRAVAEFEAVGGSGSAHAGGYPSGVDGVGQNIQEQAGDRRGEGADVELAVSVGAGPLALPVDTVQARLAAEVGPLLR